MNFASTGAVSAVAVSKNLPADSVIFDKGGCIMGVTATVSGRSGLASLIVSGVVYISVPAAAVTVHLKKDRCWLKKTRTEEPTNDQFSMVDNAAVSKHGMNGIVGRVLKISPSHGGRKEVCVRLP